MDFSTLKANLQLHSEAANKTFGIEPIQSDLPETVLTEEMGRTIFLMLLAGNDYISGFTIRQSFVRQFSWAIPDLTALELIARYGPIIEIGAGSGFWSKLLANIGVEVVAFDDPHEALDWPFTHKYFDIQPGSAEKLTEYPGHTLFLCWPPMTDFALNCLKNYAGQYLIYVGENAGGCTGEDDFFEERGANWEEVEDYRLPQWFGIHDYLTVYKRVEGGK
jgi:hypothetical protein